MNEVVLSRVSTLNSRATSSTGKLCPNVLTYQRRHLLPSTLYLKMCACQAMESKDVFLAFRQLQKQLPAELAFST